MIAIAMCSADLALAQEKELGEVKVTAPRTPSAVIPTLQDEIVRTERFTTRDIQQTNASNVNEAIDKNPGISVQVECSICNVRNIVLNNLPGRYTTLLIDGIPLFSSVSGAYGFDMVGVNGVQSIDVARGAAVSLFTPEALGGTVNIITRRPSEREVIGQAQGGDFGYARADAFLGLPFEGGAATVSFNFNDHIAVDQNGNRVSEYSGYKRYLGGIGGFLDDVGGFAVRGRVDYISEDRNGGWLGREYDLTKRDRSGNPFYWSGGTGGSPDPRGWVLPDSSLATGIEIPLPDGRLLVPYDGGRAGFSEIIFTDRYQGYLIGDRPLGDGKLRIAGGYAYHKQDSFYEGDDYDAKQNQAYGEVVYTMPYGETLWTTGASFRYEDLRSNSITFDGTAVDGLDNYTYRTPGVFIQAFRSFLDNRAEVVASLRYDYNNVFHGLFTPRLNALFRHTAEWASRVAVGTGYRFPTSFFEVDHGILATTRIVRQVQNPEKSKNASYALSYASDRLSGVASLHWTQVSNPALLDADACLSPQDQLVPSADPTCATSVTVFGSGKTDFTVAGADAVVTYRLLPPLDVSVGGELYTYDFVPEQLVPGGQFLSPLLFARPNARAYFRADYEAYGWLLFARATWTSTQNLARFYDYTNNPRYNLDGTPKLSTSPPFWTADVRAQYTWKNLSFLAGINNIFDYRQVDREDFLWVDAAGSPDVTQMWGPNLGRSWYIGLKADLW